MQNNYRIKAITTTIQQSDQNKQFHKIADEITNVL